MDVDYLSKKLCRNARKSGKVVTKVHENKAKVKLRAMMPAAQNYAYFDHAAVGPIPRPAAEAIRRWLDQSLNHGDVFWPEWSAAASQLRQSAACLLHCNNSEIGLIPNTTFGINVVAQGYPWNARSKDNVVVLENEFSSNLLPWANLERRGVEVRKVPVAPDGVVSLDSIRQRIDGSTRIVAVSWVGYLSGYRVDLAALCDMVHGAGAQLFVDAIQGLGVFSLNTSSIPIDYLAADGHKWMLGPEGAGILYIRQDNLERLEPLMLGWGSLKMAHQFQTAEMVIKQDASRYEGGSSNFAGQIGLSESLRVLLSFGCNQAVNPIAEAVLENAACIEDRLRSIGAKLHGARSRERRGQGADNESPNRNQISPNELSGIVTFTLGERDPMEIRKALLKEQIVLSVRHGCLRVATHAYNTSEDIDRLIEGLNG
ncbi:MAG: aminotransferase class V-fold PLP-dependent enzyme [Pirellula sp.]